MSFELPFKTASISEVAEIINRADDPESMASFYAFGFMLNLVPQGETLPTNNVRAACSPVVEALKESGAKFAEPAVYAGLERRLKLEAQYRLYSTRQYT